MECKILTDDAQFKIFVEKFAEYSGIVYPFQYLRLSKVYGVFTEGKMTGGFILTDGANIRWMKQVPLENNNFFKTVDPSLIFELNGVWMDKFKRKSRESVQFWRFVSDAILAFGKPIPTYAYLTERKGLASLYKPITSGIIYSGCMIDSDKHITICYSNLFNFRYFKVLYLAKAITRSLKGIRRESIQERNAG